MESSEIARRPVARLLGLVCGAACLAGAGLLAFQGPREAGPMIGMLVLGGLGLDAVIGAMRARPSLLMRIGPLP